MIMPKEIHPSWNGLLTEEILAEIKRIEEAIGTDYNPADKEKVLRFLTVDLDSAKVVWLGQDVYPAAGVATGRSFEVGNLTSWLEPFRQVSLKNIVRLIYKTFAGIEQYDEIPTYTEIKRLIKSDIFPIVPPAEWFSSLEKQGVLFLNTSFTCQIGVPNSHRAVWAHFSCKVMEFIAEKRPDLIWFLWGREAQSNIPYIQEGIFLESRHPARVRSDFTDDFLRFNGFKQTWDCINWLGE